MNPILLAKRTFRVKTFGYLLGYGIISNVAPQIYDALLYVENTTATRLLGAHDHPGLPQILRRPANNGFEDNEAGKPPVDWYVRPELGRFDFEVLTSEERPHTGSRCAMISRLPGRHYGEMLGSFTRRLDGAIYQGKKIRFRAAARAELSGEGNLS